MGPDQAKLQRVLNSYQVWVQTKPNFKRYWTLIKFGSRPSLTSNGIELLSSLGSDQAKLQTVLNSYQVWVQTKPSYKRYWTLIKFGFRPSRALNGIELLSTGLYGWGGKEQDRSYWIPLMDAVIIKHRTKEVPWIIECRVE